MIGEKVMFRRLAFTAAALLAATPALAHSGHAAAGFVHGFAHPIGGLDHVLAMVAVGLWAAQIGGNARWALPVTFVLTMSVGALLGLTGVPLPGVEAGILASVVALGAAIACGARLPLALSAIAVAAFAVFHGVAHGTEMPFAASGLTWGAGFSAATALLHAAGLAAAALLSRAGAVRPLGGLIAASGLVLAAF